MNLLRTALLGAIWIYQNVWSHHAIGACRHVPSCSHYADEAVRRHGTARGTWLALRRLLRCNPLGTSGYDPVP